VEMVQKKQSWHFSARVLTPHNLVGEHQSLELRYCFPAEIHLANIGSITLRNAGTRLPDYMTFRLRENVRSVIACLSRQTSSRLLLR